jgi:hypothetical protein
MDSAQNPYGMAAGDKVVTLNFALVGNFDTKVGAFECSVVIFVYFAMPFKQVCFPQHRTMFFFFLFTGEFRSN